MRRIKAIIAEIRLITPTILELILVRKDGREFPDFLPGQYATLSFPSYPPLRGERSFSIASSPVDRSFLRFGIRISGKYTTALSALRQGEEVNIGGPYGHFVFDSNRDQSVVFIAGGIGITPFFSMIQAATILQLANNLTLFYSVRSEEEAAYKQEFDALEKTNQHFRAFYAVSDGKIATPSSNIFPGRISRELLGAALAGNVWNCTYFLCGPPPFMKAMTESLQSMGITNLAIRTERFGIGSQDFIERGTPIPKYVFAGWGIAAVALLGIILRTEHNKRIITNATDTALSGTPSTANSNANISTPTLDTNTKSQQSPRSTATNTVTPAPNTNTTIVRPTPTPAPTPAPQPAPIVPRTRVS